jgi:predicted enzyme involved in methoxymalonyl-ACP biosynthesis
MAERELQQWLEVNNRTCWVIRVVDKFGDSGLTGLISLEIAKNRAEIIDFVLSCRVMGRKIEETMVCIAVSYAHSMGLDEVYAKYIPTANNKPCLEFWEKSAFVRDNQVPVLSWNAKRSFPQPDCVEVDMHESPKRFRTAVLTQNDLMRDAESGSVAER